MGPRVSEMGDVTCVSLKLPKGRSGYSFQCRGGAYSEGLLVTIALAHHESGTLFFARIFLDGPAAVITAEPILVAPLLACVLGLHVVDEDPGVVEQRAPFRGLAFVGSLLRRLGDASGRKGHESESRELHDEVV